MRADARAPAGAGPVSWTAALALSLAVHAGAAGLSALPRAAAERTGGGMEDVALAGAAFADQLAAGDPAAEALAPLRSPIPAAVEPVPPAAGDPVPGPPAQAAGNVEPLPPAAAAQSLQPLAPVPPPEARAGRRRTDSSASPRRRPETAPAAGRRRGSGGHGRRDAASGDGGTAGGAGSAAVSGYPGRIRTRLLRALRSAAAGGRRPMRGEAEVGFTIAGDGSVSGLRIVRSSGRAALDEAMLGAVRRAAPFPAIPPEAGRSSWSFQVPLRLD